MAEFTNYMEEVTEEVLDNILPTQKDLCKCEHCRLDIIALALNRLPPKYVVTTLGRAHTKLEATKAQFRVDITTELVNAIKVVKNNPRHKPKGS
jgi:competence protein ComFB